MTTYSTYCILLYDPKQKGTFHSSCWKKDYSPDLCFVTCDDEYQPLPTTSTIEPHSLSRQHRPSITTIGLDIPTISSVEKPRWNFRKANWPEFAKSIAESINRIPPRSENYQGFCKLVITKANKYIPRGVRKSYIPGQMKARPYSNSTKIMGIPTPVRRS